MRRFLISTLLFITVSLTLLPLGTFAQNSSPITFAGSSDQYIIGKILETRVATPANGGNYDGGEYVQVLHVDTLTNVTTKAALYDKWIIRNTDQQGTYRYFNGAPNQTQGVLSVGSPVYSGTTSAGFKLYDIMIDDEAVTSPQSRKIAENKTNPTRFDGYDPSKHGTPPNSQTTPPTQNSQQPDNNSPCIPDPQPNDGISAGTCNTIAFDRLPNPLGGAGIHTTGDAIDKFTTIIMIVAIPFVTIMIMYAGFSYIAAYGNPEKIRAANKRALWTLVGTILLFGAATIGNLIIKTVQKVTTDGISTSTNTGGSTTSTNTQTTTTTTTAPSTQTLPTTTTNNPNTTTNNTTTQPTTNGHLKATYRSTTYNYVDDYTTTDKALALSVQFDVLSIPSTSYDDITIMFFVKPPGSNQVPPAGSPLILSTNTYSVNPKNITSNKLTMSGYEFTKDDIRDAGASISGFNPDTQAFDIGMSIEIKNPDYSYTSIQSVSIPKTTDWQ